MSDGSILYVADDLDWVHGHRLAQLRKHVPGVRLQPLTARQFARGRRLGRYRRRPVYFASWRILFALERGGLPLRDATLGRFMASVTSHYNLGGGLAPETALPAGQTQQEALERAGEVLRKCAVVTANSSGLASLLAPVVPDVIYAPNGVDTEFFTPAARTAGDALRLGWVGKVKAAKNFATVEEVAARVDGNGFEPALLAHDKDADNLLDRAAMRDYYRTLDVYLCASWHEGTPNPALEAAACGVPIVTTRVGNMPDLIREGESGSFVDPDADSIVARLLELRDAGPDELERLSAGARASVDPEWSWSRRALQYRGAFDRLVDAAS